MVINAAQIAFFGASALTPRTLPAALSPNADEAVEQLPSVTGAQAKSLMASWESGFVPNQQLNYDETPKSRGAIAEYLLTQHGERREQIRAMVGIDLYA
ncbi:hypothetical protein [Shewanella litorisediminis]|uniref:Uncharacterized protein n=1 Tax=Shewanella litorisediminis TaxID=1173586 RepID=A0ABX7FYV1_9GAMM|nr:hypothetical protein [Shewanella litorisediminis]MCL2918804.1 hypothetical protein [Shewanella litorisediminis]QRH00227.1 hypothetical protein JQC75_09915 [Shewanella litorisediminis]